MLFLCSAEQRPFLVACWKYRKASQHKKLQISFVDYGKAYVARRQD